MRRGFTLIEILVVVAVIAVLVGMGIPAWGAIQKKARRDATRTLVLAVAAAIDAYGQREWTVMLPGTPPTPSTRFLWDLDGPLAGPGDGILDGQPAAAAAGDADGPFAAEMLASGYGGFMAMTRPPIDPRFIDAKRRVIDAWKRPLRIAFARGIYGHGWFGVWSDGADGVSGSADDLCSWTITR